MSALFLVAAVAAGALAPVDVVSRDLQRPEGPRHYLIADPAPRGDHGVPLVILLHGHGGSAQQLLGRAIGAAPLSTWLEIAARDGLVVIAPDGARGSDDKPGWNDCRADAASNPRTDDLGFIAALIDSAVAGNHVDPKHVYVMGMSNGGFMTFRLGVELPRIAAIATVGASMAARSQCQPPSRPLSVLMINGDADPLVPYQGGDVRFFSQKSRGSALPVEDAARGWRVLDALAEQPAEIRDFAKLDPDDKTLARMRLWGGDPRRPQVELIKIEGGGHVEPSIRQRIGGLYRGIVGAQNGDFEAAEEAWRFFRTKTR
ncbi:MAG TPA: PHB depolymerase family esterase [Steroidobacteraceae bacterium]|nr:PHB depolymerase family esterase [Steroidobacteraceae bacterium]